MDLRNIIPAVQNILRSAMQAYAAGDADAARRVLTQDSVIDAFYGQFIRKLAVEAARSPEAMASHIDALSIAKNLERIADHATNIAEDVLFLIEGVDVRHHSESRK